VNRIKKINLVVHFDHNSCLTIPVNGARGTIRFDNFENFPGAPVQTIIGLAQDRTGFLWMTTSNDIIRFDGIEFVSFRDRSPEMARSLDVIDPLFTDDRGRLWIATRNGVYLYNDTIESFTHYKIPLTPESTILSPVVHKIAEDPVSKKIFFLAEDGVIYTLVEDGLKAILNLPVEGSKFMTIDDKQNIWISGNNIIFRYNIGSNFTTKFILEEHFTNGKDIFDIIVDDSTLYIAALKSEIIKYEPATGKKTKITVNKITPNYYCFLKEDNENIWIGSAMGLYYYNTRTGSFDVYKPEDRNIKSLSSTSIYRIFKDRQGNLWLGTAKGLNVSYVDQKFDVFGYRFGNLARGENVSCIKRDSRGNLWVGYAIGGIDIFDRDFKLIRSIEKVDGIKPVPEISQVFDFHEDSEGYMWFGTYMQGLFSYCLSTGKIRQFYPGGEKGTIPGSDIRSITFDREGNLWLAVHGSGVVFFERKREVFSLISDKYKDLPDITSSIWPFKTLVDARGNLWIGTNQGAVYRDFSNSQSRVYSQDSPDKYRITHNNVTQVMEDSHGRVWLGTQNGLNIIDGDSITRLTVHDGFISHNVSGIIEDRQGRIWVSTNMGLVRLIKPAPGDFRVKNFNKHDGLYIEVFSNNAYFSCKEHLYFGGIDGFVFFNPDNIVENKDPFPLVFTFFQLFNKIIRPGEDQ
jgi:ligand-binding sensor domain-containing protein